MGNIDIIHSTTKNTEKRFSDCRLVHWTAGLQIPESLFDELVSQNPNGPNGGMHGDFLVWQKGEYSRENKAMCKEEQSLGASSSLKAIIGNIKSIFKSFI